METKKSKKVNLESRKGLFFQIGIIVTLATILIAFEWTSTPLNNSNNVAYINDIQFEEEMIVTRREELKPPVKQPEIKTVIDIVDNDIIIDDEITFDVEVDNNTEYVFTIDDDVEEVIEEVTPFYIVEDMPTFNGGDMSEFWKYAMKEIKYPELAAENGISGTVYMQFTVSTSGYVTDVKIIRGVHPDLDEESIRVIKNSPRWEPGKQRGKKVPVIMSLPMKFILQ